MWTQCERETEQISARQELMTDSFCEEEMESIRYDKFSSTDMERSPHQVTHQVTRQPLYSTSRQNRRLYVIFGVLSLYLLILTLSVGIKISQVDAQVSQVNSQLIKITSPLQTSHTASLHAPNPLIPVKGSCEAEWLSYKDKCYFSSNQRKTWQEAEKSCIQRQAHLVVVNDQDELEFLGDSMSSVVYWIGLVEREEEGKWSWVDGTDFYSTEHFWDEGQPDNWDVRVNGEDCGQLHLPHLSPLRLWNDADCTLHYHFICEKQAKEH